MNSKVWLSVFGVIAAVVLGATGYYAATSYGKYKDALSDWDGKVTSIVSLERRVPYPNQENTDALTKKVKSYEASVQSLQETLKSFQPELNTSLQNTEFQLQVKTKVEEFRATATQAKMEIESATDFQLGFDAYSNSVPPPSLVPVLDYELEAIDHLLRKLIDSGAETLIDFVRDPVPGEAGSAPGSETEVVQKYPVRFRFSGTYETLQKFVNELANDRQFFYIVRIMKVKNSATDGPLKLSNETTGSSRFENPITKEIASAEMLAEWGEGTATEEEVAQKAKEAGFIKADLDARVLMGLEKLSVYMLIDIARFPSFEKQEGDSANENGTEGKRSNSKK